ncbi:MAG: hypothetical protein M5U09_05285 [Gammaproteobacteria bacterium]|nr:hypothetical protein [Gammaproteobacteria bacterium]
MIDADGLVLVLAAGDEFRVISTIDMASYPEPLQHRGGRRAVAHPHR